jgi:hypothetical protein
MPKYTMVIDIEFESENLDAAIMQANYIEEYIGRHAQVIDTNTWNVEEIDDCEDENENIYK